LLRQDFTGNVVVTSTKLPDGTIQRRINFGLDYGAVGASGATPMLNLTPGEQQIELSQELDTLTNELIYLTGHTKSTFISDSTFSENPRCSPKKRLVMDKP